MAERLSIPEVDRHVIYQELLAGLAIEQTAEEV